MEKEAADVVVSNPGVMTAVSGAVLAAMGWLSNKVYRSVGHRINNAHATASSAVDLCTKLQETKADKSALDRILSNQATLFDQQREDSQRTVDAITTLTNSFNTFAVHVEQEFGKRPTRDEISERRATPRRST